MDTGKEINENNHYTEKLQEIKEEFSRGLSKLLVKHYNHAIIKYGNWKKYPRKVKKYLKKEQYWNLRESDLLKDSDIKVEFNF